MYNISKYMIFVSGLRFAFIYIIFIFPFLYLLHCNVNNNWLKIDSICANSATFYNA